MSIDLYLMNLSTPCRAVLMVAKHLNIEFNAIHIDLRAGQQLTPEFVKLNPAHTVPTIVDNGFALWESRAIIQYLCNKYDPQSQLYPTDPKARALVDRNLNFDMSYYRALREAITLPKMRGYEPSEDSLKAMKDSLKLFDTIIGNNKYVTGDNLTIADLSLLASSTLLWISDTDITDYPNLKSWYDRLVKELTYFDEINGKVKEQMLAYFEAIQKARAQKN